MMLPSQLLREAATEVERERKTFGCHALASIVEKKLNLDGWGAVEQTPLFKKAMRYYSMFKPAGMRRDDVWFLHGDTRGHRILALCMAADIAESEGQ